MSLANPFAFDDPIARASEALVDAAALGRVEPLRAALRDGGNPNHMRLDISPAMAAVSGDYLECLEILVDAGGGGDLPNRMGWTALHEAAIKDDVRFLTVLLNSEFEQDLSPRDRNGWTPLRAAVDASRLEAVAQLLAASPAQLDMVDRDSVSPVMAAANKKNVFLLTLLLNAGADVSVEDMSGKTLAHYVHGWPEGEALLEEHGMKAEQAPQAAPVVAKPSLSDQEQENQATPEENPFGLGGMKKMRKGP